MARDLVSIGSEGWYNSTGGTPDNTRWGSYGWFQEWILSIGGSTGAIALFTDGYFEYTNVDQSLEVIGSFGLFRGTIAPVPGDLEAVIWHHRALMHQ
jgi:hypothetical protein